MTPEELLSQLKTIHEPAPIGTWPLAPGWWILLVMAIAGFVAVIFFWRRHIKNNAWKKDATKAVLALIKQLPELEPHQSLLLTNQLIKRIAIYKYNDDSIKALTGKNWFEFMSSFLNGPDTPNTLSQKQLSLLSEGQYTPGINTDKSVTADITALLKKLKRWIQEA